MKVAIHGRAFKDENIALIQSVLQQLVDAKVEVFLFEAFSDCVAKKNVFPNHFQVFTSHLDFPIADFAISIGGDGTLLESVTFIGEKEIPILGINTGRLGYLANVSKSDITLALKSILDQVYEIDERTLIKLESDKDLFQGVNFGVNELAILKRDTSSMIIVHTYINDEFLNSYWADGLLVSTPTGSTGYSLSCGGPVVMPRSNSLIITPVSPHNLNVRPLVVPDDVHIKFQIEGRGKNFLVALDSRSRTVDANVQLAAKKEKFKAKLITVQGVNYLNTLRTKLNWGLDVRN